MLSFISTYFIPTNNALIYSTWILFRIIDHFTLLLCLFISLGVGMTSQSGVSRSFTYLLVQYSTDYSIVALGTASKYLSNPFSRLWINNRCPLELFCASVVNINNRLRCLLLLEFSVRFASCILYLCNVLVVLKGLNYLFWFRNKLWVYSFESWRKCNKTVLLFQNRQNNQNEVFCRVFKWSVYRYYFNFSLMNEINEKYLCQPNFSFR